MGKVDDLNALVSKYTTNFPAHHPRPSNATPSTALQSGDIVLLTGTTGGLGCILLRDLAALPSVARVYAFNRKDRQGRSLRERQATSLEERGLDPKILDSPKVILVEGDTSVSDLGISSALFTELRDSVTLVIHNAWRINLIQDVFMFESLIRGVRNLVDFALASWRPSPPRIVFLSSISSVQNWQLDIPVPERALPDARVALGVGYGESKWVSERILHIAAEQTALRPLVVRVGQLTFGQNGSWNSTEYLPTILRSAITLGTMPTIESPLPLLPLSVTATSLIEMTKAPYSTLHLSHPRPVSASYLSRLVADHFGLKLVPLPEFVARLEDSVDSTQDPESEERNPAVALLPLFHAFLPRFEKPGRDAITMPILDTTLALKVAPSLAADKLPPTGMTDLQLLLRHWRESGMLPDVPVVRTREQNFAAPPPVTLSKL
ncbi:hypothetical protein BOTBODRAFT_171650 [Botryobasidium botryosum FD-172 SS1]|uniref:Thioester reductase (TE) domain-containing protein n=1 Tax=Botryobasidium botryosum (strain FD-172 SS1) TaxID=930990 RepID=A0A067N1D7_BOTB1|nr:hypothetical protein BOTBODRAFT_171650 [Botryobasidium botryosum FD-172 SS1]